MDDIEARVKRITTEQLDVSEDELTPGADIEHDLGADSLDRVELTMALEEAFGIEIPDEDAERIRTVQQVIDYVKSHLPAQVKKS